MKKMLMLLACGLLCSNIAMAQKIPFKWEKIGYFEYTGVYSYRAQVIGGWVVMNRNYPSHEYIFIADPKHEWEIAE